MKRLLAIPAVIPAILLSQSALAEAFNECPAQAFLTQGTSPQTYGLNLVTGDYTVLTSDMGTNNTLNGLGFNPVDQFIYGWSYEHGVPVRIHSDWQIEPLDVDNISGKNFFVGDVHPSNNKYYVYRRGVAYGLYAINLDRDADDYLKMERIVDGRELAMVVADMAINPVDEIGYAVSHNGELFQIDLATGKNRIIADTGVTGGFGASYFDPDGNLYIANNADGKIFRLGVSAGDYKAQLFANGPASSINDGSRCALAPVIDVSNTMIDFGDAPDSYGTKLASNGARHSIPEKPELYLGSGVDGESDSSAYPLSDDKDSVINDEDGIGFATTLVEGRSAVVVVKASAPGFLSAWIDVDQNGQFDANDQVMQDVSVEAGKQAVYIDMPFGVTQGASWARFRLSSSAGLEATGGAPDGEVEDYEVKLTEGDTTVNYYPSQKDFTTVAFEDNWPHEGDYDMNDLVAYLRTATHTKSNGGVTQVDIAGEVAAVGAAYHNGFAIRLPGVKRALVDEANMKFSINGKPVEWNALEEGREEAILIVTYNLWDYVGSGELCEFYRTEPGCGGNTQMRFEATIPLLEPVVADLKGAFDPFLFATPGAWHGGHFVEAPGRGYEVHLKNRAPTEAFDSALFDAEGDDASVPPNLFFQTERGLPWALEIGTRWDYPVEHSDVGHAYSLFQGFAESNGNQNSYWYDPDYANAEMIFSN